jgi:hypothetical protein
MYQCCLLLLLPATDTVAIAIIQQRMKQLQVKYYWRGLDTEVVLPTTTTHPVVKKLIIRPRIKEYHTYANLKHGIVDWRVYK